MLYFGVRRISRCSHRTQVLQKDDDIGHSYPDYYRDMTACATFFKTECGEFQWLEYQHLKPGEKEWPLRNRQVFRGVHLALWWVDSVLSALAAPKGCRNVATARFT